MQKQMLITAGPTHEPIDAVRFIGNRSSGRMGCALADAAAGRGWAVTLLLGPMTVLPTSDTVSVKRFRTCEDLGKLLKETVEGADVLVMAAAVADFRPKVNPGAFNGKFRRTGQTMTLELESTPDLLAGVALRKRSDQYMVGFALEPREELEASAKAKMERKRVDMVVGNPLETMESTQIEGIVFEPGGKVTKAGSSMGKGAFALWLLELIEVRVSKQA